MKRSRWRDRNAGGRKSGAEGDTREDDAVMSMWRAVEVVRANEVAEVKEVVRPWPLKVISSRTFFSLELETGVPRLTGPSSCWSSSLGQCLVT